MKIEIEKKIDLFLLYIAIRPIVARIIKGVYRNQPFLKLNKNLIIWGDKNSKPTPASVYE